MRPPIGYPHIPGLPPHMPQQMLFPHMQNYGQIQQPGQAFGAAPPQQINLQLQQPTMQISPPTQSTYTRKTGRGKNAIRIINPETGAEVKVDAGSNESPQPPRSQLTPTPAAMTSSVTAPGGENSTRSGPSEEFKRMVARAASEPRPPPPPNAIIRNPNDNRQQPAKEEDRKKEEVPASSVPQGKEEKEITVIESNPIVESTHPLSVKPTVEESSSVLTQQQLAKAGSEAPTEGATVPAPAPTSGATLVDSTVPDRNVVSHEKTPSIQPPQLPSVETSDSATPSDGSTPFEAENGTIQQEREEQQEVPEATTEAPQAVSTVGPKMVESATGEKLAATHDLKPERPTQLETKVPVLPVEQEAKRPVSPAQQGAERLEPSVQQEKQSSTPTVEEPPPSPPHGQIVSEPSSLPASLSKSQSTDSESSPLSSHSTEDTTAPVELSSAPEIPPATEDKRSSEPISSTAEAETPIKDEEPQRSTEMVSQSELVRDSREREKSQKLESQPPEAVVTPESSGEEIGKEIESQPPALPVSEPPRTKEESQLIPDSEREKGNHADEAVVPEQQEQQEVRMSHRYGSPG